MIFLTPQDLHQSPTLHVVKSNDHFPVIKGQLTWSFGLFDVVKYSFLLKHFYLLASRTPFSFVPPHKLFLRLLFWFFVISPYVRVQDSVFQSIFYLNSLLDDLIHNYKPTNPFLWTPTYMSKSTVTTPPECLIWFSNYVLNFSCFWNLQLPSPIALAISVNGNSIHLLNQAKHLNYPFLFHSQLIINTRNGPVNSTFKINAESEKSHHLTVTPRPLPWIIQIP